MEIYSLESDDVSPFTNYETYFLSAKNAFIWVPCNFQNIFLVKMAYWLSNVLICVDDMYAAKFILFSPENHNVLLYNVLFLFVNHDYFGYSNATSLKCALHNECSIFLFTSTMQHYKVISLFFKRSWHFVTIFWPYLQSDLTFRY